MCAHIRRNWKTVYAVPHKPTRTDRGTATAQPACLSIQAVATSSTLSVRAPCSTGTDISGTDLSTAGALVSQGTGQAHHQEGAPEDFTLVIVTQGVVPPVLEWGWGGQLCIRGVGRTCLCPQEVTEATARPFKEKPSAT